jgi:5'-nucleotidase
MSERYDNVILMDMDGTMVDFDGGATAHLPRELIVPRTNFYIAQDYPEEIRPSIEAAYNAPDFFENLEPMPDLLEAWQMLLDNGFDPRVASAPLTSNRCAVEGKIKWLDRVLVPEFGVQVVERAIIDKNKWKYPGLAIIDDRPAVPRGENGQNIANWEHIIFGWPHLQPKLPLSDAAFRLIRWKDTSSIIPILQELANSRRS